MPLPEMVTHASRFLFFTGKGGVGKTSLAAATALALAESGQRVLLVSTDAASNLDAMLGAPLAAQPVPVPDAPGLSVQNIDPDEAAEAYRARVVARLGPEAGDAERARVREELSGACTTEIAAFDAFASLLAEGGGAWDHIVVDTAPTGHTLRLLSLPKAWSDFLAGNERGASCLGPHSGLTMQEDLFNLALSTLCDPSLTTVVLVARPDPSSLAEAARTADELRALGVTRQRLAVNGVFHARADDATAAALERLGRAALAELPPALAGLPREEIPLRPFDTVGLPALRALFSGVLAARLPERAEGAGANAASSGESLARLVDALAEQPHGLVLVMGKGGVGKTTLAAAVAVGLVRRGHSVLLTTTDPAAHLARTLDGHLVGLEVGRIDPKAETDAYVARQLATRGRDLDDAGRALLLEDLRSPCTEEVAVFHAFSRVVSRARTAFVVLDTAPTGHSLLLMDATGAYHRQVTRDAPPGAHLVTPLMRLQDPRLTRVLLVTLPEPTPILQATALEADLRRAGIAPWAWVLNKSMAATGTTDPLLRARVDSERRALARLPASAAGRLYVLPWLPEPPVGLAALDRITTALAG